MPPVLDDLVVACLRKDPAARPRAAEIAMALEPLVAALPDRPRLRHGRPQLY